MSKEKIQDKIKKLLALSNNNSSSSEAESAFLKAQELMLEHKIEMNEFEKGKEINIVKDRCESPANTPWAKALANIFATNFGCMLYYSGVKRSYYPTYFGNEEDTRVCKEMYDYAVNWLNKVACNYATMMRNTKGIVKGVKGDFILGFLKGLEDKFNEQVNSNNQYALMVVVPEQVKEEYEKLNLTFSNRSNSVKVRGNEEARSAGYTEGKSFGTNRIEK